MRYGYRKENLSNKCPAQNEGNKQKIQKNPTIYYIESEVFVLYLSARNHKLVEFHAIIKIAMHVHYVSTVGEKQQQQQLPTTLLTLISFCRFIFVDIPLQDYFVFCSIPNNATTCVHHSNIHIYLNHSKVKVTICVPFARKSQRHTAILF